MGYTFDVELHETKSPMTVDLDMDPYTTQTVTGCIILDLDKPTSFSVAKVSIIGQVGIVINPETPDQAIAHESLLDSHQAEVDLIAANDTNGDGCVSLEGGRQFLPFRIDIRRAGSLPPTLSNKLDTPYIDWRYHLVASVKKDSIFSTTQTVQKELILRRQITPIRRCDLISTSIDQPKKFRSRFTIPSTIHLKQETLEAKVELKAREKEYMIKEIDCSIIQHEKIAYETRRGHPIKNAGVPGYVCKVECDRIVSPMRTIVNEANDMAFGKDTPLEFSLPIDNLCLLPDDRGLGWFHITHKVAFKIHFMDVNLPSIKAEMPLFVGHAPDEHCENKDGNSAALAYASPAASVNEEKTVEELAEGEEGVVIAEETAEQAQAQHIQMHN